MTLQLSLSHTLKNIQLEIAFDLHQEILVLFGPSGAGKSVTLQMIAGLIKPNNGHITLNERILFDYQKKINLPPQQRRVGYVMQDYVLFPHLSVAQNIAYGLKGSKKAIQRVVIEMLNLIQLPDYAQRRPYELSGGQQQRVALAQALATQPDILLLDEPFSALDGPTRRQLRTELKTLLAQVNIPTLLVTHDLAEANLLADRIAVYDAGKILQTGPPTKIMYAPASLRVAQLGGIQNSLPGIVAEVSEKTVVVLVGAERLVMNKKALAPKTPLPWGEDGGEGIHCCIRAEQIILLTPQQAQTYQTNILQSQITTITTDGLSHTLNLCVCPQRLLPQSDYDLEVVLSLLDFATLNPQVGQMWAMWLNPDDIHLVRVE